MNFDDPRPASFDEEESADLRYQYLRQGVRLLAAFIVLFAGVYYALSWSGAAVRFGASRVADRGVPTWHVIGVVRDARTRRPIPWAVVDDDASGRPPFHHADADHRGVFDLLTLAEPHSIRVTAPGYYPIQVPVGRAWFLWMPKGEEKKEIELQPEM